MKKNILFWSHHYDASFKQGVASWWRKDVVIHQAQSYSDALHILNSKKYDIQYIFAVIKTNNIEELYQVQQIQMQFSGIPLVTLFNNSKEFNAASTFDKVVGLFSRIERSDENAINNQAGFGRPAINNTNVDNKSEEDINLTRRQVDVLKLLVGGKSNKQIARDLNLSEGTVKIHCMAIFREIRVVNRTQAAVKAESMLQAGAI